MTRVTPRAVAVLLISATLFVLLAAKVLFTLDSAAAEHDVAMQRRAVRANANTLSDRQLAHEIGRLLNALQSTPRDADLWYHLGRNLHRLAVADVTPTLLVRQRLVESLGLELDAQSKAHRTLMLRAAIAAYDRAIAANQIISGARVWRVAAEIALAPDSATGWDQQWRPALEKGLAYDPDDPRLWRAAGDLALEHNDNTFAVRCYWRSLRFKLDGIEHVAGRLLGHPEAMPLVGKAIPDRPDAWRRLADYLFAQWRFDAAADAWARTLAYHNQTPLDQAPGEAVADGDFTADSARLLHPWRETKVPGVETIRETDADGGALRVVFHRGPGNWYHVRQAVPVEPGARYRLRAEVKVDGFVPDETFGVEVVHPYEAKIFAAVARCYVGGRPTKSWPVSDGQFVTVETELTVPAGLRMLHVRLRRFGGEDKAVGRVWFKDVSLQVRPQAEDKTVDEG